MAAAISLILCGASFGVTAQLAEEPKPAPAKPYNPCDGGGANAQGACARGRLDKAEAQLLAEHRRLETQFNNHPRKQELNELLSRSDREWRTLRKTQCDLIWAHGDYTPWASTHSVWCQATMTEKRVGELKRLLDY
jgi:uncharacterized protein YecT (DUF1311 family)